MAQFDPKNLDQNVVNLARAMRQVESGNKAVLPAEGAQLGGASRYQYTTSTWKGVAKKYLGNANAPMTAKNEDQTAYMQIKEWKDSGKSPKQIASMWNAGPGEPNAYKGTFSNGKPSVGTNSYGVKFSVPNHAEKVYNEFTKISKENPPTDQKANRVYNPIEVPKQTGVLENLPGAIGSTVKGFAEKFLPSVAGFGQTLGGAAAVGLPFLNTPVKQAQQAQQGLEDINAQTGKKIIELKKQGKDTGNLEKLYQQNTGSSFDLANIVPESQKIGKQIYSEGLGTLGTIALASGAPTTILGRLGFGTLVGTGAGAKKALDENQTLGQGLKTTAIGAGKGFATAGILEGISTGLSKLAKSTTVQKFAGKFYNREFQPPVKELSSDIEKGFKTFGEQASQVTDVRGNPVYVGGYNKILNTAKSELNLNNGALMTKAKDYANVTITRDEAARNLVQKMQDTYGKLSQSQIKQIQFEVARMPVSMNIESAIKNKRLYDNLIPDTFWSKIGDPAQSFPSLIKYTLRDNLRQLVNEKTADPIIQQLNNNMSIAMDMKKLAAAQLGKAQTKSGSISKSIYDMIDNLIFNPAITTRAAQTLRGAPGVGKDIISQGLQTARVTLPFLQNKSSAK